MEDVETCSKVQHLGWLWHRTDNALETVTAHTVCPPRVRGAGSPSQVPQSSCRFVWSSLTPLTPTRRSPTSWAPRFLSPVQWSNCKWHNFSGCTKSSFYYRWFPALATRFGHSTWKSGWYLLPRTVLAFIPGKMKEGAKLWALSFHLQLTCRQRDTALVRAAGVV